MTRTTALDTWVERLLAMVVLGVVVSLPLVFVPGLDDGYAFPKVTVLRVAGLIGAALIFGSALSGSWSVRGFGRRIDLPLIAFAGLLLLSAVFSVDPVQSFAGEAYQYQGLVTGLLYIGSFYVAGRRFGTARAFRTLLLTIVSVGAVVSVYGIAQRIGADPFWSGPPDARIISSVGQANDLAAFLDLVVVAAMGLWPAASSGGRVGLAALMVLSIAALALTFSRGGYLGLALAMGVVLVGRSHATQRRWAVAIVLACAVGVAASSAAIPAVRATAEEIAARVGSSADLGEGSIREHLDAWRVGAQVAVEHPLLGTGPETFPLVFRPYLATVLSPDQAQLLAKFRLESPHNELIAIGAELGLPALVVYLVFLIGCSAFCLRQARDADNGSRWIALVVLGTLVTHVVTTSFKTPDITTSELFWVMTGAGLAALGRGEGSERAGAAPLLELGLGGVVVQPGEVGGQVVGAQDGPTGA